MDIIRVRSEEEMESNLLGVLRFIAKNEGLSGFDETSNIFFYN
jgi:hypothetical protein